MAMIKITEENFMSVAGRIKKFFDHGDVVTWHNYRNSRHIQGDFPMLHDRNTRIRPIQRYTSPKITIVTPKTEPIFNKNFIRMSLDEENGGCINIGDEVSFHGNRIHLKTKNLIRNSPFAYEVFQHWDPNGGFKDIRPDPLMGWDADDWMY